MTRVVEISAEAVAGVRRDLAAVCVPVDEDWRELRSRARELGVATSAFDDVLTVRDRLGTLVLPVIDTHLERARALEDLRYGPIGGPIPVLDLEPAPFPQPFTQTPFGDGSTTLTWEPTRLGEIEADQQQAEEAHGIGEWFSDRWDDLSASVSDGVDWVADRAADAWDEVTEAGAAISDWWDRATADVGAWIDQNLDGVRDFIGRHVGVFRLLADALRVVGKILIITGAALTLVLGAVGGLVGFGAGTLLGGVGGVPAGLAGAGVGAAFGLKILGAGFTAYSLGALLDVAADWGEGTIDGQELVQRGALELGIAVTSLLGIGVIGKIIQKGIKHLPASWRGRIDDRLAERSAASRPSPRTFTSPDALVGPLANHIESVMPGRITGVNTHVPMRNGLTREVDIEVGDIIIQVKDQKARNLQRQIEQTVATTGRPTVGYAPGMPHGAWLQSARDGVPIARDPQELIAMIEELS